MGPTQKIAPVLWWKDAGFANPPTRLVATGKEILHRVLNRSTADERNAPGGYFTFVEFDRASEAERALNIVAYENRVRLSGRFSVRAGTVMWVGDVAHGPLDVCTPGVQQVYIANPVGLVELVDVTPLKADVFVAADPSTGKPRVGNA